MADDTDLSAQAEALAQRLMATRPIAATGGSPTPTAPSFVGLLGEALGGGPSGTINMTPEQQDAAGRRALLGFGMNMLASSGYSPVRRTLGESIAQGLSGASQAMSGTEAAYAAALGRQQDLQMKQAELHMAALKEAIPLLRLQQGANIPNTLLGAPGTTPGTSIGAVGGDSYESAIAGHEGTAKNPNSSAFGTGQFLESTWQNFAQANPELFKGMSPAQVLAARADPKIATQAITWLAQQNADALTKAGVTPSGTSLGIAHYLGASPAAKVMTAPDNAPVSGFVSDAAVKANPELATMTVGQLKQRYANTPAPAFLGGKPAVVAAAAPASTAPATAAPGAPAIQMGGPPPAPPNAPPGASTAPSTGGVGAALAAPGGLPPDQAVTLAKATGKPVPIRGGQGAVANPDGTIGTPGGGGLGGKKTAAADIIEQGRLQAQATPVPPGTVVGAGPAAGVPPQPAQTAAPAPQAGWGQRPGSYGTEALAAPGVPPAAPAPQPPAPAPQPPAGGPQPPAAVPPGGRQTFEQFQQAHPLSLTDEERASTIVTPPDLAAARAAQTEAARQLSLARQGISGDPNKSLSDYNTATQNVAKLQADAAAKSAELQQAMLKDKRDTQRQLYDAEQQRLQQADEAERQRQAAIALKTQEGEQAKDIERIKAGISYHQKLDEQSAQYAQENVIKPQAAAAMKAHEMNLGLQQLQPLLKDLPPGGGALGAVLDAHPSLAPLFSAGGILTDRQADAVKLIQGLTSNLSTEMKPAGLGALREYEFDAFKAQLPNLLQTPAGQAKALALLMNMNDRIQRESAWTNKYFNRKVPDDMSDKPGAMRTAHNLDVDGEETMQQRMDRELGPIIPRYAGPPTGSGQAQWEGTLAPGKPYYKTWAVPDPKNPGQPLRDANGNVQTTQTLEVRPWQ